MQNEYKYFISLIKKKYILNNEITTTNFARCNPFIVVSSKLVGLQM